MKQLICGILISAVLILVVDVVAFLFALWLANRL